MNCMYEAMATVLLHIRNQFLPPSPSDYEACRAEDNLEDCRMSFERKERELSAMCSNLARDALQRKKVGDIEGAKQKLRERKRQNTQLDKIRNSIAILDRQLEALRNRELDRELMQSLKLSSQVMKKAGIRGGVEEAEKVMNELDSQIRQSEEITNALAIPLSDDSMMLDADAEMEELNMELEILSEQYSTPQEELPRASAANRAASQQQSGRTEALHHRRVNAESSDTPASAAATPSLAAIVSL